MQTTFETTICYLFNDPLEDTEIAGGLSAELEVAGYLFNDPLEDTEMD